MARPGKSQYDATSRRAASEERRARILATSRRLFLERGYTATTMAAIARESGVNVDTIYELVGRKPELFRLLVETAISGRGEAVPAEQREYVRTIHEQATPEGKLAVYAAALPAMHARLAPLVEVLKEAGAAEPDLARMWEEIGERRRQNMARLAAELAESGRLAVDEDRAADVVWTLNSPEVYLLVVVKRGWSHDQYTAWLRDTWTTQLLAPRRGRRASPSDRRGGD